MGSGCAISPLNLSMMVSSYWLLHMCRIAVSMLSRSCVARQGPYVGIEMKRYRSQTANSSVGVKELLHHCVMLISDETKEVLAALF